MARILEYTKAEGQACLPLSAPEAAAECVKFATSPARKDDVLSPDDISVKIIDIHVRMYVVFFPASKMPIVFPLWMNAGVGISSRLAEDCITHAGLLHEVSETDSPPKLEESKAQGVIRERIAELLERVRTFPDSSDQRKMWIILLVLT
jgi:cystathionine gamma-synthase